MNEDRTISDQGERRNALLAANAERLADALRGMPLTEDARLAPRTHDSILAKHPHERPRAERLLAEEVKQLRRRCNELVCDIRRLSAPNRL